MLGIPGKRWIPLEGRAFRAAGSPLAACNHANKFDSIAFREQAL
jgi:hypothetical protein